MPRGWPAAEGRRRFESPPPWRALLAMLLKVLLGSREYFCRLNVRTASTLQCFLLSLKACKKLFRFRLFFGVGDLQCIALPAILT